MTRRILGIGIPSAFENSLFQAGRILVVSMISTFGTVQIAANAVANNLDGVGWIPFDTVPGYEENIVYQLPEDGDPAENEHGTPYTGQDQPPQQNQTDISQEPQDDHSQRIFVQRVLLA